MLSSEVVIDLLLLFYLIVNWKLNRILMEASSERGAPKFQGQIFL